MTIYIVKTRQKRPTGQPPHNPGNLADTGGQFIISANKNLRWNLKSKSISTKTNWWYFLKLNIHTEKLTMNHKITMFLKTTHRFIETVKILHLMKILLTKKRQECNGIAIMEDLHLLKFYWRMMSKIDMVLSNKKWQIVR